MKTKLQPTQHSDEKSGMKLKASLILLLSMGLLGCGSDNKTSTTLDITNSFSISSSGFGGGLIVVGEKIENGKRFSMAMSGSTQQMITLEKGTWKFLAVGWDGTAGFTGERHCGFALSNLSTDSATVEISVNQANCSSAAILATANLRSVLVRSCGTLSRYDSNADTFLELGTTTNDNEFCSTTPKNYQSHFTHYKLFAINGNIDAYSQAFSSSCLDLNGANRLTLPTMRVPFVLRKYTSLSDCNNSLASAEAFIFPNGLADGFNAGFDHNFKVTDDGQARLALPSGITKRGYSPFMNLLPRILCAGTDCINDPGTITNHVRVPWTKSVGQQLLLKDAGVTSCPAGFMSTGKYFSVANCTVKDNDIYGDVYRNRLTCQGANTDFNQPKDIYIKNGLTYILWQQAATPYYNVVTVLDAVGKTVSEFSMGSSDFQSIAASETGLIIVARPGQIAKFQWNSTNHVYTPVGTITLTPVSHVDVAPNGSYFVVGFDGSNLVKTYLIDGTLIEAATISGLTKTLQLELRNDYIYVLGNFATPQGLRRIPVVNIGTGDMGTPDSVTIVSPATSISAFASNDTNIFMWRTNGNVDVLDHTFTLITTFDAAVPGVANLAVKGNILYPVTTSSLKPYKFIATTPATVVEEHNVATLASSFCGESIVASTPSTTLTLNMESRVNEAAYDIYNKAFDVVGRRTFTSNDEIFYYFRSLNDRHDDEKNTGGELRRAQQMLGPDGIAGAFSDLSCSDLVTKLASGPITRTLSFIERDDGTRSIYTAIARRGLAVDQIDNFICNDSDPNVGSCATQYDVIINMFSVGMNRNEKIHLKLSCTKRLGVMESLEIENSKENRDYYIWNTQDVFAARFESFSLNKGTQVTNASVVKVFKSGVDTFSARSLNMNIDASLSTKSAEISELHRDPVRFTYFSLPLSDTYSNFSSSTAAAELGTTFDVLRDNMTLNHLTIVNPSCMTLANVNLSSTNVASCVLPEINQTQTSKGMDMNISSFDDADLDASTFRSFFSLQP